MIWIELRVQAEAEAVESVAELFSRLGHGGVAIEEPLLEGAEPGRVEIDPTRLVIVKSYLPEDEQAAQKVASVEEGLWHLSQLRHIEPLQVSRLAEEDWAEAWKQFFYVQRIGRRVVIKPTWREYQAESGDVVVEMDPGMAFGTGQHPTTRMCVLAIERLVREGMRVLDVGAGSGILSMAAARLGAASVVALEIDPVAVEVARKNVALNGLEGRVRVYQGSLELLEETASGNDPSSLEGESGGSDDSSSLQGDASRSNDFSRSSPVGRDGAGTPSHAAIPGNFDLVLANIIARVIVELAEGLRDALAAGGGLVVSGIIAEREGEVREALTAAGLVLEESMAEGDWRAMVWRRGRA